jgi:hypothetical protein
MDTAAKQQQHAPHGGITQYAAKVSKVPAAKTVCWHTVAELQP